MEECQGRTLGFQRAPGTSSFLSPSLPHVARNSLYSGELLRGEDGAERPLLASQNLPLGDTLFPSMEAIELEGCGVGVASSHLPTMLRKKQLRRKGVWRH